MFTIFFALLNIYAALVVAAALWAYLETEQIVHSMPVGGMCLGFLLIPVIWPLSWLSE